MTNPFENITDPADLLVLVQDGVKCEACKGWGRVGGAEDCPGCYDCSDCYGTGHTPLPNAYLDALAACWCEGEWVKMVNITFYGWARPTFHEDDRCRPFHIWDRLTFHPTTDPVAAMRLSVKYGLYMPRSTMVSTQGRDLIPLMDKTVDALCHALTEAALIAALIEAIVGASHEQV